MTEPLFLKPVFQEKIWGGRKLASEFDYDLPAGNIGECWAISAHPHGPSTIENGPLKGKTLDKAWQENQEYFGNVGGAVFPLLTKILDAEASLSVQVHPDDAYAQAHVGKNELGKTECWYIIDAEADSYLIYGHHAQTKEELTAMIEAGDWDHLLRKVPVKTGDFIYVPSGSIHALNKGIMVLETQQSSDTTYRLYDYDRVDEKSGQKRELHIADSIATTTVPHVDPKLDIQVTSINNSKIITYVKAPISEYFNVYQWEVNGELEMKRSNAPYTLASVISGQGQLIIDQQTYEIHKNMHFIIPNQIKNWTLNGQMKIIASEPGEK